jgi:hypothetical protein
MRPVNIETVDEKNEVGELDEILAAFRQLLNGDIDRYSKQVTVASRKAALNKADQTERLRRITAGVQLARRKGGIVRAV